MILLFTIPSAALFVVYAAWLLRRKGLRGRRYWIPLAVGALYPGWSLLTLIALGRALRLLTSFPDELFVLWPMLDSVIMAVVLRIATRDSAAGLGPIFGALVSTAVVVHGRTLFSGGGLEGYVVWILAWHLCVVIGLLLWRGRRAQPGVCVCGYSLVGLPRHTPVCPECGVRLAF